MPSFTDSQTEFLPRFIRLRDAPRYLGMDKNRFNHDVRPHVTAIPSALKASRSIALIWTPGRITISTATGVPRLNLKGESHGKLSNVRPHQSRWDLAHRQAVPRKSAFAKALERVTSRKRRSTSPSE